MKKATLLFAALVTFSPLLGVTSAKADQIVIMEAGRPVHYHPVQAFIIENHRPIRRDVFVDDRGRYFRIVDGHRVFIEHAWDHYPKEYFYDDGRVRENVKIVF